MTAKMSSSAPQSLIKKKLDELYKMQAYECQD